MVKIGQTRVKKNGNRVGFGCHLVWCAYQDSNLGTWFRRPVLYPLSYRRTILRCLKANDKCYYNEPSSQMQGGKMKVGFAAIVVEMATVRGYTVS